MDSQNSRNDRSDVNPAEAYANGDSEWDTASESPNPDGGARSARPKRAPRAGKGNGTRKKSDGGDGRTVRMDLPRSAKPFHKIFPILLFAAALFVGTAMIFDLFCNQGNRLADDPSGHWMGLMGYWTAHAIYGSFGVTGLSIPILAGLLAICWKRYVDHKIAISKILSSILFAVALAAVVHVFCLMPYAAEDRDLSAAFLFNRGVLREAGGAVGGKVGFFLYRMGNFTGALIILFILLPISFFYSLGMTPQHLWSRFRNRKTLRAKRNPSLSEQEAEDAGLRAMMEEKIRRTTGNAPEKTGATSSAVVPAGDPADATGGKKPRVAPIPMPNLDPEDDDTPFVPSDVNRRMAEQASASDGEKPVEEKATPKDGQPILHLPEIKTERGASAPSVSERQTPSARPTAPAPQNPARPMTAAGTTNTRQVPPAPARPASAQPEPVPNPEGNRDAVMDEIFPRGAESRQVSRTPRSDRNFDLQKYFINLDDLETAKPRAHADLPPEVPMTTPGAHVAAGMVGNTATIAPGAASVIKGSTPHPVRTRVGGSVNPSVQPSPAGKSAAAKPPVGAQKPVFRQNTAPSGKNGEFGLSDAEFEQIESKQLPPKGKIPAAGAKPAPTAGGKTAPVSGAKPATGTPAPAPAVAKPVPKPQPPKRYQFPPITYLHPGEPMNEENAAEIRQSMKDLSDALASYRVSVSEINYSCGPTVTRYEVIPASGVRIKSIVNLSDDIARSLRSSGGIRIEAPIPGTDAVGIEVPNRTRCTVYLRDLIENQAFAAATSKLNVALGADITGHPLLFDISKMPHMLIAGTTGSGKSVCINCIVVSLLYKARPDEVKLIMIDPKKVEFSVFKNIPHLMAPIVTTPKDAAGALQASVEEMERRFEMFEQVGVRNIKEFNTVTKNDPEYSFMPQIVIIIDELADLMMTAKDEVETAICRIAQKARAAGIHLIVGTQRPSVDVVTGLIKSNIPSRIAFTVASQVDSKTILDYAGAEKLAGRGDMLFAPIGSMKPARVQGAFVDTPEVEQVCEFLRTTNPPVEYDERFIAKLKELAAQCGLKKTANPDMPTAGRPDGESDEETVYVDALRVAVEEHRISTSLLQRKLHVGYGRASSIIDRMVDEGYVSAPDGSTKARTVYITPEQFMEKYPNG